MSKVVAFLKNESGATAIEYGLIAAGISVVIIATVNAIGSSLNTKFNDISTQLKYFLDAPLLSRFNQPVVRSLAGRNLSAAAMPAKRKAMSAISCAIRNGGSDWVGASGLRNGNFWNDWTISTSTLR
jgi:Flp pilus assembly protein, pilin Flp